MFSIRDLGDELAAVRESHAPSALVVDCEGDFETLPPAQAEELGLLVDGLDPVSYPESWLPADAPDQLRRYAGDEFTIGLPGDGGVTWTRQTEPPTVFVKARTEGAPEQFLEFLIAEALVEAGLDRPEQFLGFFGERSRELAAATPLGPADTYQLAVALYDAHIGLTTRGTFRSWAEESPRLHEAWADAGDRLRPRLSDLSREVAAGETDFAAAAELACSGVKHGLPLPTPFGALDTEAYRETGPEYAVAWARKTFEELEE
ncbi:hypothetical protein BRC94_02240 [Halobacteriales archaeon QS_5_70_17]|nr:MAG: hypothetical protein BRC94_02240 [Halobacteriales archaeon QS_5_70_17]